MLAQDGVDRSLPVWHTAHQKPQCLRCRQCLCGEPCISHIDSQSLIPACQFGMRDREVEVVLQRLESQQLQLGVCITPVRPDSPDQGAHITCGNQRCSPGLRSAVARHCCSTAHPL